MKKPTPRIVRPGDYWTKLAAELGFDADEVWNDAKNEEIRRLRPKRELLAAGDIVYVPGVPDEGIRLKVGTENQITAKAPGAEVKLRFKDPGCPGAAYTVEGVGEDIKGNADGDGVVTLKIPVHVREVFFYFDELGHATKVKVGELDPIEEDSGVRQRLEHLRFIKGPPSGDEEQDAKKLAVAIGKFQKAQGLPVTEKLDDATKNALKSAHSS
jgi:hypothetical protein